MKPVTQHPTLGHILGSIKALPVTLDALEGAIKADLNLGFAGTTIVPAVLEQDIRPEDIVELFTRLKARALVCGFLPGNGPDPFTKPSSALASLETAATMASQLHKAGCGPATMVGPMHTHHRMSRKWDTQALEKLTKWFGMLNTFGKQHGLDLACEPLNGVEDSTPDPFDKVIVAAAKYDHIFLHCDTGHMHARGLGVDFFEAALPHIAFFEMANVGRSPLSKDRGIDFKTIFSLAEGLLAKCVRGIEPFSFAVQDAFNLRGGICDTDIDGPETAHLDAIFLRKVGMLA